MEPKHTTCNSCHSNLLNQIGSCAFTCPQCAQHEISRCKHCRSISAHYTCPVCSFTGPN